MHRNEAIHLQTSIFSGTYSIQQNLKKCKFYFILFFRRRKKLFATLKKRKEEHGENARLAEAGLLGLAEVHRLPAEGCLAISNKLRLTTVFCCQ